MKQCLVLDLYYSLCDFVYFPVCVVLSCACIDVSSIKAIVISPASYSGITDLYA